MQVKAAPGLLAPKEENPKEYIDDTDFVDVPNTPYYRRLVDDGSLVEPETEAEVAPEKKKRGGEK